MYDKKFFDSLAKSMGEDGKVLSAFQDSALGVGMKCAMASSFVYIVLKDLKESGGVKDQHIERVVKNAVKKLYGTKKPAFSVEELDREIESEYKQMSEFNKTMDTIITLNNGSYKFEGEHLVRQLVRIVRNYNGDSIIVNNLKTKMKDDDKSDYNTVLSFVKSVIKK